VPTFESSISIAADREAIWGALASVTDWPAWLPTVRSVEPLDGPTLSLGARFRVVQPKLQPATWVVTALEAPNRFSWQSRSPGVLVLADHVIEERSPGEHIVVLRVSFSGLLGRVVGLFFGSLTARYLAQESAALKQRVKDLGAREG
jgi:uncharacterized membrane protein